MHLVSIAKDVAGQYVNSALLTEDAFVRLVLTNIEFVIGAILN